MRIWNKFLNGIIVLSFLFSPSEFLSTHFGEKDLDQKLRNYLDLQKYGVKVCVCMYVYIYIYINGFRLKVFIPLLLTYFYLLLAPSNALLYSVSKIYKPSEELVRVLNLFAFICHLVK